MLYALAENPYHVSTLDSGIVVAKKVNVPPKPKILELHTFNNSTIEGKAEFSYYAHLREWIKPLLDKKNLAMQSIYTEPSALPDMVDRLPARAKAMMVVRTLPRQEKYLYTVGGLFLRGDVRNFSLDSLSEPSNHYICVPTAIRRLGLIGDYYFREWKKKVNRINPAPPPKIPTWTGHVMSIESCGDNTFQVGDQYGSGQISRKTLVEIATTKNSFQGDYDYHLQIFIPKCAASGSRTRDLLNENQLS